VRALADAMLLGGGHAHVALLGDDSRLLDLSALPAAVLLELPPRVSRPQSNSVAKRCLMLSAMYSASACMVHVGFTPPEVTKSEPSTMNKFFTS